LNKIQRKIISNKQRIETSFEDVKPFLEKEEPDSERKSQKSKSIKKIAY